MADTSHKLYTPTQAVDSSIAALYHEAVLARLVSKELSTNFTAGTGATVNIKSPTFLDPAKVYTAENRKNDDSIEYSTLNRSFTPITISDHAYEAIKLGDELTTFTIEDLESEVIAPAASRIAEKIETTLVNALKTTSAGLTKADTAARGKFLGADDKAYDSVKAAVAAGTDVVAEGVGTKVKAADLTAKKNEDVGRVLRTANRLLKERGVSAGTKKILAVGSGWAHALTSQDNVVNANQAGDADGLRNATLVNRYGFTIVEVAGLDTYDAFAFDPAGIGLALVAPKPVQGHPFAAVKSYGGFTMRYAEDYDMDKLANRVLLSVFVGAKVLDPQRVIYLPGTEGFEEKTVAPVAA